MRSKECVHLTRVVNGQIIMEYSPAHNDLFVACATHISISFAYGTNLFKLANLLVGFRAYYSRSRAKIRHATAILTKRLT